MQNPYSALLRSLVLERRKNKNSEVPWGTSFFDFFYEKKKPRILLRFKVFSKKYLMRKAGLEPARPTST